MADLPIEGRTTQTEERREVELTLEQRVAKNTQDIQEVARGVNAQAQLLESIVLAFDHVVKRYLEVTKVPSETKEAPKE